MTIYLTCFETIKLGFSKGHPTRGIFLDVEKVFAKFGTMDFSLS